MVAKRKERGEKFSAQQKAKKARIAEGASDDAAPTALQFDDTPGEISGGDADLPKGCAKYDGWKVGFMIELFKHCEPALFSDAHRMIDSKTLARQLFEFAFDLRAGAIAGRPIDRPNTRQKAKCFAALRDMYCANGRQFRRVVFGAGGVDWHKPGQGVYKLVVEQVHDGVDSERGRPTTKFLVRNTITQATAEVSREFVGDISGADYVKLRIDHNFSSTSAELVGPPRVDKGGVVVREAIHIQECFPKSIRTLKRRISDTLEISTKETRVGIDNDGACSEISQDTSLAGAVNSDLRPSPGSTVWGTGREWLDEEPCASDAWAQRPLSKTQKRRAQRRRAAWRARHAGDYYGAHLGRDNFLFRLALWSLT